MKNKSYELQKEIERKKKRDMIFYKAREARRENAQPGFNHLVKFIAIGVLFLLFLNYKQGIVFPPMKYIIIVIAVIAFVKVLKK